MYGRQSTPDRDAGPVAASGRSAAWSGRYAGGLRSLIGIEWIGGREAGRMPVKRKPFGPADLCQLMPFLL